MFGFSNRSCAFCKYWKRLVFKDNPKNNGWGICMDKNSKYGYPVSLTYGCISSNVDKNWSTL
jgi:hypothetical protein